MIKSFFLRNIWAHIPNPVKRLKTVFYFLRTLRSLDRVEIDNLHSWLNRGFAPPSPAFVKRNLLAKWGGCEVWIESGTYLGETTEFLSNFAKKVISIEPQLQYAQAARKKFEEVEHISIMNGLSEDLLPTVLTDLIHQELKDVSFWLDGHFSADNTFKGPIDTPIQYELEAISKLLPQFAVVTIFVDDVRCFYQMNPEYSDYPSVRYLSDWANSHGLFWTIEQDIFIATNRI